MRQQIEVAAFDHGDGVVGVMVVELAVPRVRFDSGRLESADAEQVAARAR